ncbi:TPR domain protein [Coniochaeta sp. 2T2.1]|nr:TPR domain protein [Coniochaeta sp. 2T2.1]
MDIQDVSDMGRYAEMMRQVQANVERAGRRKGEIPKDHPPAYLQINIYMMQYRQPQLQKAANEFHLITTQIPPAYPPSIRSASELEPILISQMKLETHHRGSKIVVRVMVPGSRMNAVLAIVEDEKGTATLLQVYHQPDESVAPAAEILQEGCCYLIKEPYFKATTSDGSYSIRVDHPSDIVRLKHGDGAIPNKWRNSKAIAGTSKSIRMQGNDAVGKKSWAEAERLYTLAIDAAESDEDKQLAFLNRSLANLRLGRPANALSDAIQAGGNNEQQPSEKALFRQASALYQLDDFEQCMVKLQLLTATYPASTSAKEAKTMTLRTKARLHEQQTGEYNFRQMYKQAKATPPLIDCATYSPVEIRVSPGRGRGLFTTRKVAAGELLICEKAFGYCYASKDEPGGANITFLMNVANKRGVMGGQATLLTQLVQKMYHDSNAAQSFAKLHHGDYKAVPVDDVDGKPVVDSFLVERVMALNGFGAPRISQKSVAVRTDVTPRDESEKDIGYATCGVWYTLSHINHACVSKCRRSFIGDMQMLRAARDMDAGTELFFWKLTPKPVQAKRKILKHELLRAIGTTSPERTDITKATRTLEQLEQTYSAAAKKPGAVRFELWEAYFALGIACLVKGRHLEAVDSILKGFEALGFIITASPRRGKVKSQEARLKIDQWGVAMDVSINAFLHLSDAYQAVAPQLFPVARKYAETAYTIVVGEKETFYDTYPEYK